MQGANCSSGVQYLAQTHFDMQVGGAGIQTGELPITRRPALPTEPQPPRVTVFALWLINHKTSLRSLFFQWNVIWSSIHDNLYSVVPVFLLNWCVLLFHKQLSHHLYSQNRESLLIFPGFQLKSSWCRRGWSCWRWEWSSWWRRIRWGRLSCWQRLAVRVLPSKRKDLSSRCTSSAYVLPQNRISLWTR